MDVKKAAELRSSQEAHKGKLELLKVCLTAVKLLTGLFKAMDKLWESLKNMTGF